jgi:PAS domain S-box-containing protein
LKAAHKIAASLAGAALLVALGVALSFWSFRKIREAAEERAQTDVIIKSAGDLLSALKDAETGQRGYLLTGNEAFLEPYMAVRDSVRGHLEELRRLALSSAAHKHLDALAQLVDAKMAELSHVIELRRNQNMTGALAVVGDGLGKRLMDSIRVEVGAFIQIEEDARAQHDGEFRSDMRRLFTIITAASLLMLLLALSFAYLIYRETQHRLQKQVHLETKHLLEIRGRTNKQLQQANVTLQASEEKLAVTLNSIGDAVIAADAEGCVTRLNPLAEKLTGWTQAQALGRPVDEIFHVINQETRQPAIIPVRETLALGTIHGVANHTVLIALGGSECPIADSCAPIRDRDGQVVGAVLVFRDVTKEYAARQTLLDNAALIQTILNTVARLNLELEQRVVERTAELQSANRELEAFSYSVSHDLRAPLRHVTGFVRLLQNGAGPSLSEENLSLLTDISEAATRMGALIDDLLTFSRVGKSEMRKTNVNLDALVRETLGDFQAEINDRKIALEIGPLPDVWADRVLLRMALVNLISNAVKFTGERTRAKIEIGCAPGGAGESVISIRDNGAGFDPQYADKLFGVFQRLHDRDEFEGTGIGLANVQRIIHRHGGRTWAEGMVDSGATFYFSLPKQNGGVNGR